MAEAFVTLAGGLEPARCTALHELLSRGLTESPIERVPIIAPVMMLGDPALADMRQAMLPPPGHAVLHEAQSFRQAVPGTVPVGRDLALEQELGAASRVFEFKMMQGAEILGEMQTRLRFVSADVMRNLRGAGFSDRMAGAGTRWRDSVALEARVVAEYLELADDPNPIHREDAAARAAGLSGTVVPGMLLCGLAEYALVSVFPKAAVAELKTRFMAAVPVGQAVRMAVVPRKLLDDRIEIARVFTVTADDVIAAITDVTCSA